MAREIIPQSDGNGRHPILEVVPLSLQTLWRLEKAGRFPRRVQISEGRVGWYADEIAAWQEQRARGCLPPPQAKAA